VTSSAFCSLYWYRRGLAAFLNGQRWWQLLCAAAMLLCDRRNFGITTASSRPALAAGDARLCSEWARRGSPSPAFVIVPSFAYQAH